MKNELNYYQNQRIIYEKLYSSAKHDYDKHYQLKETAEDFAVWCAEGEKIRDKMDYYYMILLEIEDVIIALNNIIECEKNIEIYKKRLTNK